MVGVLVGQVGDDFLAAGHQVNLLGAGLNGGLVVSLHKLEVAQGFLEVVELLFQVGLVVLEKLVARRQGLIPV